MFHYNINKADWLLSSVGKDKIQLPLSESHIASWRSKLLSDLFLSVSNWVFSWGKSRLKKQYRNFFPATFDPPKSAEVFFSFLSFPPPFFFHLYKATLRNPPYISAKISSTDSTFTIRIIFSPFSITGVLHYIYSDVRKWQIKEETEKKNPFTSSLFIQFFLQGKEKQQKKAVHINSHI